MYLKWNVGILLVMHPQNSKSHLPQTSGRIQFKWFYISIFGHRGIHNIIIIKILCPRTMEVALTRIGRCLFYGQMIKCNCPCKAFSTAIVPRIIHYLDPWLYCPPCLRLQNIVEGVFLTGGIKLNWQN